MKRSTKAVIGIGIVSVWAYLVAPYLGLLKPKTNAYITVIDNTPPISWRNQTELRLETLVINGDDNYRTIVNKSEVEGLKDLQSLVSTAAYEEIWIYTPANSTWSEVGISPLSGKLVNLNGSDGIYIINRQASPRISQASDYLNELIQSHNELVMYHIHPLLNQEVMEAASSNDPAVIEETRRTFQVIKALPSKDDLLSMVSLASKFYFEKPSGKLSFRIITPLGIVQYDFTNEGKDMMVTHNRDALKGFSLMKPVVASVNNPIDKIYEIFESANSQQNIFRFNFLPYN